MNDYEKLIFVDGDDICRAPMAKIIMQSKHLLNPLEIESRGLVVLFQEPISPKAEAVLISNGYQAKEHRSTQLQETDIGPNVLVLTMEDSQKEKIWQNYQDAGQVYTLTEYMKKQGDIIPVHGAALTEYGACYEVMESLIKDLVIRLNEEAMGL